MSTERVKKSEKSRKSHKKSDRPKPSSSSSNPLDSPVPLPVAAVEELLNRCYQKTIEAPAHLALLMGAVAKQVMLARPENLLQFVKDYFSSLASAAPEPSDSLDLENFLQTYAKTLESSLDPTATKLDFTGSFTEPPGLRPLLIEFSREFIRYCPQQYFTFCSEYFRSLSESRLSEFLMDQAKANEGRWRAFLREETDNSQ